MIEYIPTPGMERFWTALGAFVENHCLVVDRPAGSRHPSFPDVRYPLDYGYLEDTSGGDGEGIDVWVGAGPEGGITGIVCTLDVMKGDLEIKILMHCTQDEQALILAFHQQHHQHAVLIPRSLR